MCLQRIEVYNKYTGQSLTVDCGYCVDCRMKRAQTICAKIVSDYEHGYNYYFVTFTYDNSAVPYVLHQSIKTGFLSVFRGDEKIGSLEIKENYLDLDKLYYLKNHQVFGAVGVIVWDDIQKFFKRLRKNYGFTFSYIAVSEYGETFYRPHFHVLFKTKVHAEIFKSAVISCWSFCDWSLLPRAFETAVSPQKYLSLYVASTLNLLSFLLHHDIRPKKTHSLHFGFGRSEFGLFDVFRAAESHDVTYYQPSIKGSTSSEGSFVPYPTYVLSRYFPKFKGFGKLSFDDFLFFTKSISKHDERYKSAFHYAPIDKKEIIPPVLVYTTGLNFRLLHILTRLRYDTQDVSATIHAINRCYEFARLLDVDFDYYLFVWYHVYITVFSQSLRESLLSCKDFSNYYFNYQDFINMRIRAPTLNYLLEDLSLEDFSPVSEFDVKRHNSALRKYYKYDKNKKIKILL